MQIDLVSDLVGCVEWILPKIGHFEAAEGVLLVGF